MSEIYNIVDSCGIIGCVEIHNGCKEELQKVCDKVINEFEDYNYDDLMGELINYKWFIREIWIDGDVNF